MTDTKQAPAKAPPDWVIQPERVRLREDEFHVLHVSVDGNETPNVEARCVFPLSQKADYVSFVDENGKEAVLLARPRGLDGDSRRCLEKALDRMYYMARIERVDEITETMGVSQWKVQTDRGYAVFEIADRRRHIRSLRGGRYLVSDADGNRFEIEDLSRLDERSQALVATEV